MALFTDTVTVYLKQGPGEWTRRVVSGVQWTDEEERDNANGRIRVTRYAEITFPGRTAEVLPQDSSGDEDCILYGSIQDEIIGGRISDLLKKYPRSGIIQSIRDYSNRSYLKHKKVVIGTRKKGSSYD